MREVKELNMDNPAVEVFWLSIVFLILSAINASGLGNPFFEFLWGLLAIPSVFAMTFGMVAILLVTLYRGMFKSFGLTILSGAAFILSFIMMN